MIINWNRKRFIFEISSFLDKKKNKKYRQPRIQILNGDKMYALIIAFDLNMFWKPKIVNKINEDDSKYREFAWLFFQVACKYNIPLE